MARFAPVSLGDRVKLKDIDANDTNGFLSKRQAAKELAANLRVLGEYGYRLFAEGRRALLLVLQGMDTSGKDGTIRHVMAGFNPQGVHIRSFKQPGFEELSHDFLWRISKALPPRGSVGIFNRSHYEDVLVVRVHNLAPKSEWEGRYERINQFEKLLVEGGTEIVKIFLHIDKDEQRQRLQSRLDCPKKRWKFSHSDLEDRKYWSEYQKAYEAVLSRCNTKHAPWYIVPANKKWYRNLIVSRILRDKLKVMDPHYPPAEKGIEKLVVV